jgi:imidazolonepropionase
MNRGILRTPALLVGGSRRVPRRGADVDGLEVVAHAALAWEDGAVAYAGPADQMPIELADAPVVQVEGLVAPGFVDCHTHLPFFGWRADEFEARLAGQTYRDLHGGGGGGIYRSARLLAWASDDDIVAWCREQAAEMLSFGTTTVELKTGYGLSVEGELRQARLARRLAGEIAQTTSTTLLACHAIPEGRTRADWVMEVCESLVPAVAEEGLADAVDVYVEDIAFTVQDLERVAEAAATHGLRLRCHADQLGHTGAAEAAVRLRSRSADHLNHVGPEGVEALAGGDTVAVLLPVSTLFLRAEPPPVTQLLEAGAPVALATDFNPGTSPCLSIPEAIATAASLYRMPPAVALGAATLNAAWVLGLDKRVGSLEIGKRADFVVFDSPEPAMIPYRPGHNPVAETWVGGERAHARG